MHSSQILVLAAALAVSATPVQRSSVVTAPLKKVNTVTHVKNLVTNAQNRLERINNSGLEKRQSATVTNEDVSYVASVDIGGGSYNLIVDTGSSNTWCGAQGSCEPSSSGRDTGDSVYVSYGSGSFSGEEYTDEVTFAGLTVNSQSVGAASYAQGFNSVDGIFGFGPVTLTPNTVSNTDEVPTFMDNLYNQGTISEEVLGVSFAPESGSDSSDANGELTLGGTDSSKYSGSITYSPKVTSGPSANYWGISLDGVSYGGSGLGSASDSTIVDTGTTLIILPEDIYNNFLSATGGSTDSNSGLATFSSEPSENLVFTFSGSDFPLSPSQYLVPQAQYGEFGIQNSGNYYAFIANGGPSGNVNGLIGQKFLENYYSVFDTTNSRIGFASPA